MPPQWGEEAHLWQVREVEGRPRRQGVEEDPELEVERAEVGRVDTAATQRNSSKRRQWALKALLYR